MKEKAEKVAEEMRNEVKDCKRQIVQMNDVFNKEKADYDKKLLKQAAEIKQLKAQLDDVTALEQERKQWIYDNKDSEIGFFLAKAVLAAMLTSTGAFFFVHLGGFLTLESTILQLIGGSAIFGGQMGPSAEKSLQQWLESYENRYMKANPGASKREAFEYAKEVIARVHRASIEDDEPDSWGGI